MGHAMGLSMVIPMNIFYHDNQYYHEFVFLLQAAAFAAMMLQSYGYTLNVQTEEGLSRMQLTVIVSWVVILYSRLLRFAFVGYRLTQTFYADGNHKIFVVSIVALSLMGLFNLGIFLDASAKLSKFVLMPLSEYVPRIRRDQASCSINIRATALPRSPRCSKRELEQRQHAMFTHPPDNNCGTKPAGKIL